MRYPKRGLLRRYKLRYMVTRRYLYNTDLGYGFVQALTLSLFILAVINWVWDCKSVCPIRFLHQKKYVFSGILMSCQLSFL